MVDDRFGELPVAGRAGTLRDACVRRAEKSEAARAIRMPAGVGAGDVQRAGRAGASASSASGARHARRAATVAALGRGAGCVHAGQRGGGVWRAGFRSEEHTSELQSLMRISYAVFCLKKKNTNTNKTH